MEKSKMSFEDYLLERFQEYALRSADDIVNRIDKERERIKDKIESEPDRREYYETLDHLLETLSNQVENSELFDAPDGWWHYVISYDYYGVYVFLNKQSLIEDYVYEDDFENNYDIFHNITYNTELVDQYKLFTVPARLLSPEEYANKYGVKFDTIRKWIRRGKIRAAVKNGRNWSIPELTEAPNNERGYVAATYRWDKQLYDVPEGFEFINNYNKVEINQLSNDKKTFSLDFSEVGSCNSYGILKNAAEKEKLEIYMISNPDVKYYAPGYIIESK